MATCRYLFRCDVSPAVGMGHLRRCLTLAYELKKQGASIYFLCRAADFDWIKEVLDQSRNNYDKVGHFAQGFIPAILAREILIRKDIVHGTKIWLNYIVISIVLAFSAFYELIEFAVQTAVQFLVPVGFEKTEWQKLHAR